MSKSSNIKLEDPDKFFQELLHHIDTPVSLGDFRSNPYSVKSKYFGEVKWGKFTIYEQHKLLFGRYLRLKILGTIKDSYLNIQFDIPNKIYLISSFIVLLIFACMIIYLESFYIGIIILIINILQLTIKYLIVNRSKEAFLLFIDKII